MSEENKTDLLLLNFSNYPGSPAYPYAFAQVSALARKHKLKVRRLDFMGLSAREGAILAEKYVKQYQPRMIGFTLRQLDSEVGSLYITSRYNVPRPGAWFPVEDTKLAIDHLRQATDVPIVMGGFSFSIDPIKACEYFQCDFGVWGEPDSFFENFEDVLARRSLENVKNLVFRPSDQSSDGYVSSERVYYPPLDDTEYNDEILEEIYRFHGYKEFFKTQLEPIPDAGDMNHGKTIAIEIGRGCRYQCNFCTEPHVKGRSPRSRSLDVVEEEMRFLMSRGARYFWFVCSELNCHKDHALELAERVLKINENRRGEPPVFWRSYFLPCDFSHDDFRLMVRSGLLFEQNSNFSTLDDDNLAVLREPYRTKDALKATRSLIELEQEFRGEYLAKYTAAEGSLTVAQNQSVVKGDSDSSSSRVGSMRMLWPFTSNHMATPKTFAKTARIFNEEGMSLLYDGALTYTALRVYSCCVEGLPQNIIDGSVTTREDGHLKELDMLHPTYYYSESLVKQLGSIAKLLTFVQYFHNTFMTTYYRATRDWLWFANAYSSPGSLLKFIKELGKRVDVDNIDPPPWGEHPARGLRNSLPSAYLTKSLVRAPYLNKIKEAMNPVSISEEMFAVHPSGRHQREGALSLLFYILCMEKGAPLLREIFSYLDIPTDENDLPIPVPYFFMRGFYKRYNSNEELISDIQGRFSLLEDDLTLFLFRYLIYQFNVKIQPEYASLLYK